MTPKRPAYQNRISYQATLLGGFATVSAVAMLIGDITTGDTIKQRMAEDLQASLQQVILPELHDNNLLQDKLSISYKQKLFTVYQGTREGKVSALAYEVSEPGYSGDIKLVMGVSSDGNILGVRVIAHSETPGLGDKIETAKSRWIRSFDSLSLENTPTAQWAVKKDGGRFDQFSGATITPRAVVAAVKSGLEFFNANRVGLLTIRPAAAAVRKNADNPKSRTQKPSRAESK